VPDNNGGVKTYRASFRIVHDSPLTVEFVGASPAEDVEGVHAICCDSDSGAVTLPEVLILGKNGVKNFHVTLEPIPGTSPRQYQVSNPTLNLQTRQNTTAGHYGTFDFDTGTLAIPVVDIPDATGEYRPHRGKLKLLHGNPVTFELAELEQISDGNGDTHAYYEQGIGHLPGIYVHGDKGIQSFRATFTLIPGSDPAQFELTGIIPVPYFEGITEFTQLDTNTVKLAWSPVRQTGKGNKHVAYEIYLSQQPDFAPDDNTLVTTIKGKTEYELTSLSPGQTYYVLVIAVDSEGKRSLERDYHQVSVEEQAISVTVPDPAEDAQENPLAPGLTKKIHHDEAELEIDENAVGSETTLQIQSLASADLPQLAPGMTNVTKGPRKGYRFLPHGQKFKDKIKIRIPFDKSLLPEGFTEQDILTYYYDEQSATWIALERVEIDSANSLW
jgi:hypothetical protein